MTTLAVFEFNAQEVRIIDRDGEPWFVAKDLCDVLGIQNIRQNLAKLDDDEKDVCSVYTPGGKQDVAIVSESGMYALVLTSRKPEAKPFRKWVTSEVLPTIRKKGRYSITEETPATIGESVKTELDILGSCLALGGLDPKLIAGVALNYAGTRMPQLKPGIEEGHSLLAASTPSELLLTPTKVGKELGISAQKVNMLLLELGYQIKNIGASKSEPDYLPTDRGLPFSNNTLATGKLYENGADNTTYQHLKWKSSILDILRPNLSLIS